MDLHISAEHVFIACGYTDMRKSIDGLSAIIVQQYRWLMEGLSVEQPRAVQKIAPKTVL